MRDRAAAFVEENLKTIFAYALSRVSHKEDAEDLTNDIVLAILQSADKLQDPDAFYAYVWGIAANTYRKFLRKSKRASFAELDETLSDGVDFTQDIVMQEEFSHLRREIALLSREYRECTVAYYYDGLSCAEIAKKLHISLDMVKYYLFKTRKILKEGICMEREFGEKSFKPAPFEFTTIFWGEYNPEYRNQFSKKLPGQILLSAYFTPMTVRELSIELGVAAVYLEDELDMLVHYGVLTKLPSGKYQTNLLIFTEDFTNEFCGQAEQFAAPALLEIVASVKGKLGQVRGLNGICGQLSDERLLWGLLWPLMRQGNERFDAAHPEYREKDTLCKGTTGINYGVADGEMVGEFGCAMFAGRADVDENYYASAADFNILPQRNRYFSDLDRATFGEMVREVVAGEQQPTFMILTEAEERQLFDLLSEDSAMMAALYERLFDCAWRIMLTHAPKSVSGQVKRIVFQTLFFRTVGLIGACAVRSGALPLPDFDGAAAMYVREK